MRSAGIRLFLAALLLGCSSSPQSQTDGGSDSVDAPHEVGVEIGVDASIEARTCGGSVTSSGSTPAGAFGGTNVYLRVVFVCRRVEVTIVDQATGASLAFSLSPSTDGGTPSLLGSQTVPSTFTGGGPNVTTSALVNVTMADDPFDAGATSAPPAGELAATFTLSPDGFSVSGSFSSPYCAGYTCPV